MATTSSRKKEEEKTGSNGISKEGPFDKMGEIWNKIKPFIVKLIDLYGVAAPHIEKGRKFIGIGWKKVQPYYNKYWDDSYIELFVGLTLLFFGGQFAMTIACYMAIQLSGLDTIKQSWTVMKNNYKAGMDSFEKDKKSKKFFDKDGDGNISLAELAEAAKLVLTGDKDQKKEVLLNLRCVFVAIDPQEVMNALGGFWAVAIAVIATLRSAFAKDIALGISLGQMVSIQVMKYSKPLIKRTVDKDLQKWADFVIESICRFFGISLALILVRIVSAFHSAVKGGQIFALYILKFLNNKQLMPASAKADANDINVQQTTLFLIMQYGIAAIGFWCQFTAGFSVGTWYFRLLLLPFTITEWILTWFAAY